MLKKFVQVNADASPSANPYEVRTYMGETGGTEWQVETCVERDRKCRKKKANSTSHVLTFWDEIKRLHHKAEESRFYRPFKKRCELYDQYTMCVVPQRTPEELKLHAEMRERFLLSKSDYGLLEHDARTARAKATNIVVLQSPMDSKAEEEIASEEEETEGDIVKIQAASPECSKEAIFLPDKRMLQLKRPKSRMFINETKVGPLGDLPFTPYNPREIQDKLEADGLRQYDIIEGVGPQDLWTWNAGLQKRESELDRDFIEASLPKYDANVELTLYNIPQDLDKTFTAEIVSGNKSVKPEPMKANRTNYYNRPREIAAIIVAYVESFGLNPDFWTASTMDSIITRGDKLFKKSKALNYKSETTDFDIIPQVRERDAAVDIKIHFSGSLKHEPNIYKVLSLFFTKYNACVLVSKNLYVLILKRCLNSYYIFDPNGRNEVCQRDFLNGKCSLMATRFNEHLVHLILNFSDTNLENDFSVYEINLASYGKLKEPPPTKLKSEVAHKMWAVVNENYAVKPGGNSGIQQPISGNEKNASLVVSLIGLVYSEFERAAFWKPMVIDDLIKYGIAYYKTLRKKYHLDGKRYKNKKPHLNVVDLPEMFLMGAFKATVRKRPFYIAGHVTSCKSYVDSQLTAALQQLFNTPEWPAALLQIDNSVLAIWRDNDFFYVFDPFRRNRAGMVVDPDDYSITGLATLQMHTTFESFCRILYQNALKMRRGGKFFLHGIRIGCIRPLQVMSQRKNKFPSLQMGLPTFTDEPGAPELLQKKSIQSIPEDEKIPALDETEMVGALIDDIIHDIIKDLPEPMLQRPLVYKQAHRVLLRSDKEHLRALRLMIKRGYDAADQEPEDEPHIMTLDEELQIPSNFESLPDGVGVIFGATQLPQLNEETIKLNGLLADLVVIALSAKYKISTWNSEIIEFALASVNKFGENYQTYERLLKALLTKKLPDITIGQNNYAIIIQKIIKSTLLVPLRKVLLECLINCNHLLVICQHFSCAIVKRYNFLYMFIGFPCNAVGFRKYGSGPSCLLRFAELDSLIRRIEFGCNPEGCSITNFVVAAIKVIDTTLPAKFRKWSQTYEDAEYQKEYNRIEELKQQRHEKIRIIDDELKKENKRINDFLMAKREHAARGKKKSVRSKYDKYESDMIQFENEADLDEFSETEQESEGEEETQIKHKPGKKLRKEMQRPYRPRPMAYGYRLRDKDCLFKIQGNMALEGRNDGTFDKIKVCYFASILAIVNATLCPLSEWSSYRIDRVITTAKNLVSQVCDMESIFERVMRHLTVDEYEFDLWIRHYEPKGLSMLSMMRHDVPSRYNAAHLKRKIDKSMRERNYLLLFTPNGTYALYHDEFYHLFDPYATMDKAGADEEEEEQYNGVEESDSIEKMKKKCPKDLKRYNERNTASWILFADTATLIKYIDERCAISEWKENGLYKFFVVDVLSYKKAAPNVRILQLLTDMSTPMECNTKAFGRPEYDICTTNESLGWLELENCLPVWSRLNRRNAAGHYRNLPISKFKKYDIEIQGILWSLWGDLHPAAPVFQSNTRGRQYLACYVMACCAANVYHLMDWSAQLLDTIVISGDKYFAESIATIKDEDYEFSLEDLNIECGLDTIDFVVHIEHVCFGKLYRAPKYNRMNLAEALIYFFSHYQYGILQVQRRAVAIGFSAGHDGGYFMYDCQEMDHPLFPKQQGASYMLRTHHLQVLLYCIIVTFNVPFYNIEFNIHKVDVLRHDATVEEEFENEEEHEVE